MIVVTVIQEDEVEPLVFHLAHRALAEYFVQRVHETVEAQGYSAIVEIHEPTEIVGQNGIDSALADLFECSDQGGICETHGAPMPCRLV
jgi:hypothetical protein